MTDVEKLRRLVKYGDLPRQRLVINFETGGGNRHLAERLEPASGTTRRDQSCPSGVETDTPRPILREFTCVTLAAPDACKLTCVVIGYGPSTKFRQVLLKNVPIQKKKKKGGGGGGGGGGDISR